MNTTRRGFMKTALAAGAFPILPGCATFGRDKVRVACVGVGNRASEVIKSLEKTGLYEFVALCDTDLEGEQCANVLGRYPTLPRFTDFRKMLDAVGGRIDAVGTSEELLRTNRIYREVYLSQNRQGHEDIDGKEAPAV